MNFSRWTKQQLVSIREEAQCELARRNGMILATDVPARRSSTQAHVPAKFLPGSYVKSSAGVVKVLDAVFAHSWHYRCDHKGYAMHAEASLSRIIAPVDFSQWSDSQISKLLNDVMAATEKAA